AAPAIPSASMAASTIPISVSAVFSIRETDFTEPAVRLALCSVFGGVGGGAEGLGLVASPHPDNVLATSATLVLTAVSCLNPSFIACHPSSCGLGGRPGHPATEAHGPCL